MSSSEKDAVRRAKKRSKKKEKKMREQEEKLVAKMNPGLGNKYSKERALAEIRKANPKKVTVADSTDSTKYTSSSAFFNKMQENAAKEVAAIRRGDTKSRKKSDTKSAQLKL